MRSIKLALLMLLLASFAYAGDYHQNGQGHRVAYVIATAAADIPVTGQTVNIAVERSRDGSFLDFSDNTFKTSGWTTRVTTLGYDSRGEHYFRVITVDSGTLISDEICAIISNDDTTYHDRQMDCWNVDSLAKLIKINR